MPAFALTAAEIAAAEAAAIAAAEAAAVHAAQVAAAQAAQAAAAEAAATAAAQATTQAATQATTSGIQTLAQEVAASPPTGIETLNMAQPPITGPTIPSNLSSVPLDTLNPAQLEQVNQLATGANELANPMTRANFLNQSFAGPAVNTSFIPPSPPAPTLYGSAPPLGPQPALPSMGPNTYPDIIPQANANAVPTGYEINKPNNSLGVDPTTGTGMKAPLNQTATYNLTGSGAQPAAKPGMVEEFMNMSLPNKLLTGMMGATGYEMLNRPKPYEKEKYKSTFKPGLYTGYTPVQPTPYQPNYAAGGIADLGGYSDGGRMLKGPGDGMSDDIPATIANKQPARLANEEFVIPADVVSHLGNGSSEAGAKQLYKMMERVRKARTGNKKQGKQINPEKYLA